MEYLVLKVSSKLSPKKKLFLEERYRNLTEEEIRFLEKADPTNTGDFAEWLLKYLRSGEIRLEDLQKISSLLAKFSKLKNSPKFKENHSSDINSYTPGELWKSISEGELSRKERYRLRDTKAQEFEFGPFTIYKVENVEDASILSQGTNWCTANNPTLAKEYLETAPIWTVFKEGSPYAQIHGPSKQFMDPADTPKFFTYDSTFDTSVVSEVNFTSKEDLKLLEEIGKKDPTIQNNLLVNLEEKQEPKEKDIENLFEDFSSKEFFLFLKLFDVKTRFTRYFEEKLFAQVTYPEDRESYLQLFNGRDQALEEFFQLGSALPTWVLDYYTFVAKTPAPALKGINEKEYSHLLHQAMQGNYEPILRKRCGETEYQVLNKILDAKLLRYAEPKFEEAATRLLNSDLESPEYIKLVARYAVGLKQGAIELLNQAINEQYIPEIPVVRYIRKYWPDYLHTSKGSRYIFPLMEIASKRDPWLEDMLFYQTGLQKDNRAVANITINYLIKFKIRNDEVVHNILDSLKPQEYEAYSEAVRVNVEEAR